MADLPWEIDCEQVRDLLKRGEPMLLLDCREAGEHAMASIAAARLVPMGEIPGRVDELAPFRETPIVVHCHHGGRSLRVAQWLRNNGYPQAQSMAGGIDRWSLEIDSSVPRY